MGTSIQNRDELNKAWKLIQLIWKAGFILLILFFLAAFVLHLLSFQAELNMQLSAELLDNMRYALLGLAVFELLLIVFIHRKALRPGSRTAQGGSIQQSAVGRYIAVTVLTTALLSSIGDSGLVLFVLAGDINVLLIFLGIAVAGMLCFRPNKEELKDLNRRMKRAG